VEIVSRARSHDHPPTRCPNGTQLPPAKCSFRDQDRVCKVLDSSTVCARVFFISDAGTAEGMGSEMIVAVSGLIGLGAAVLTGALWDSPLASALLRLRENLRSQGRHAMPR
jgi:hypothetical protein